jgi:hypothetical protein
LSSLYRTRTRFVYSGRPAHTGCKSRSDSSMPAEMSLKMSVMMHFIPIVPFWRYAMKRIVDAIVT